MKIDPSLRQKIRSDLGLDQPFVKGQHTSVKNCWHFTTDGNVVDVIFRNDTDFRSGMNRIYVVLQDFDIIILAFCLMDTHVHFILYGDFDTCNRFVHEYVRRTSMFITSRYHSLHALENVQVHHQVIDNDFYLKTAICYTIKNPPAGGIRYMAYDYPWGSGSLYFRRSGHWSSAGWTSPEPQDIKLLGELGSRKRRILLGSKHPVPGDVRMVDGIVFPGEYTATDIVEELFKSCKGFNYFLCVSKETDVESRGGFISHLSLPLQEMRQHKQELCQTLFGENNIRRLDTGQRVKLAKALRARYNSSVKQIARLCGLVYDEVRHLL